MKRFMKITVLSVLSLLILCSAVFMASAEGEVAKINGQEIKVGDTVTYTFNISEAEQKVTGMQMNIFFDQDVLELVEVTDGVLNGSSTINDNQNKNGRIVLVNAFMNGGGLECKDKTALATATFKVVSAAETEISYFIQYLYDIDMVDIYSYTFTCDLTSGDVVIAENKTPILADGSVTDELTAGDNFRNNQEGKGDGIRREPTNVAPQGGSSQNSANAQPVTTAEGSGSSGGNTGTIIAIVGTVVVLAAVAGVVIMKLKSDKDTEAEKE